MLGWILLAAAVAAVLYTTSAGAAAPGAELPDFIRLQGSTPGDRVQELDSSSPAALKLAEAEPLYRHVGEKFAPPTPDNSSTKYELRGAKDDSGPRLHSRIAQITSAAKMTKTLMRIADVAAIAAGNLPDAIDVRVIAEPIAADRVLALEGQPWMVVRATYTHKAATTP